MGFSQLRVISEFKYPIAATTFFTIGFFIGNANASEVDYCNFAPYVTEAAIFHVVNDGPKLVKKISAHAGECTQFSIEQPHNTFYYIRAIPSTATSHLERNLKWSSKWGGLPIWRLPNSQFEVCINLSDASFKSARKSKRCPKNQESIGLAEIQILDSKNPYIESFDPFICAENMEVECSQRTGVALNWAGKLNQALKASAKSYEIEFSGVNYGVIPTAVGWDTHDANGPYKQGVVVTFAYTETPFHSPIALVVGDILLEFNGMPVFDRDDLVYYVFEHGLNKGYDVPHKMIIQRDDQLYEIEGHQVFNKYAYKDVFLDETFSCKVISSAALTGTLREASLYTSHILGCLDFDKDMKPYRNKRCEFIVEQVVAAYRQFCPDVTFYSSMIGGVFLPGREIPAGLLRKFVFRGLKLPAKILRAITLEGAEEAARAIATLPPGAKVRESWNSIQHQAIFGAVIGGGLAIPLGR
ncbi:MAG: hypothetical protein JKY48_01690 [Flavobacteriales bacterium]|nr:hypothetical protein [Flavobacteriales bacterium]